MNNQTTLQLMNSIIATLSAMESVAALLPLIGLFACIAMIVRLSKPNNRRSVHGQGDVGSQNVHTINTKPSAKNSPRSGAIIVT